MAPVPPSGDQIEIRHGEHRATIVEVGGGIREYAVGERAVLDPYPLGAMCDGAHGAPLIPWPNRLADGRYCFDGVDHEVALTEPAKRNAIHGFLRWRSWQPVETAADGVTMACHLRPLQGYPFALDVAVRYSLDDFGLTVATTATNVGEAACPLGLGHHPYLSPGASRIDDCMLVLEADTRVVTDDERQLPTGKEDVTGTEFDFRTGRLIGDVQIDHPFTDLARDPAGRAWARLRAPDGTRAELWADDSYGYLEVYTGDTLAPSRRRVALGVEPMTCPPNAFRTGDGVMRLEPGQSITARWGATLGF